MKKASGKDGDFNRLLGRKMQILRELRNMTQVDVAKQLGYTSTGMVSHRVLLSKSPSLLLIFILMSQVGVAR